MTDGKLLTRASKEEIEMIDRLAEARSMSRSDYIRKKLFFDNSDIDHDKKTYITPPQSRHELLVASFVIKLERMINHVMQNQGKSVDELVKLNKENDQYMVKKRKSLGYEVIEKNTE